MTAVSAPIPAPDAPPPPPTTRLVEMVFPEQANHYGTLFGGTALALMGKAAFVTASRHARCPVVMASSERIDFRMPVRVGQLVELAGTVERVGRSSLTVLVRLHAETLGSGARALAVEGRFHMVAVDETGRSRPIPAARPAQADTLLETAHP
ncbi:acyl-CoA thioesterase [Rhodospira trueperi]|uniref:Acyl-CoA hydrolase n=1 Tax=Rhodospira trueperi TaxID=69960 RepID=A0A1G7EYM6_9PROT|nr:acyl-CoA thioesterase [Rhodospira trueperi]SDE68751.1 Acyl-CoA hydrolase [Rhodospira trueperi]